MASIGAWQIVFVSVLACACALTFAFGAWAATGRNDLNANADRGRMFGTRFMMLTIIFVTVVGNVFGRGENHRFRVYLSPFIVTFLAQLGGCIVTRFRRRSSTARSD